MKKYILSLATLLTLANAQGAITTNGDPFSQMDKIFQMQLKQMQEMERQMDNMAKALQSSSTSMPIIMSSGGMASHGLKDKGDHYELNINVGKGDIKANVEAKGGMLSVKVEQSSKKDNNSSYGVVKSFSSSTFMQSFTLPSDADENKVDYKIKDGKMTITINKKKK